MNNISDIAIYRANRPAYGESARRPVGSELAASIIIPAYNEESGICAVLEKLAQTVGDTYEIIVVDDGSSDETAQNARAFPCTVLRHVSNKGKGAAMQTGARAAASDILIFIDADDSYPVDAIPMIASGLHSSDLIIGTRAVGRKNIPAVNRFGNWAIAAALHHLYGFAETDPLSGLYGIRRDCFFRMHLKSPGFAIEAEIALKAGRMGLRVSSIPIQYNERIGSSKLRAVYDGYRIGSTILKMLALYNPTIVFVLPGLLIFGLSAAVVSLLLITPVSVGGLLFGTNTLLVAGMLSLGGFEFATFGIALHIYGMLHKQTVPGATGAFFLRVIASDWFLIGAATALLSGACLLAVTLGAWMANGFGPFTHTAALFVSTYLCILGLQLIISTLFLSPLLEDLTVQEECETAVSMLPHWIEEDVRIA